MLGTCYAIETSKQKTQLPMRFEVRLIIVRLVLRFKLRNRHSDFLGSNLQTVVTGFKAQIGKPSITLILWLNQETQHQF
jgi:hypothetical protein